MQGKTREEARRVKVLPPTLHQNATGVSARSQLELGAFIDLVMILELSISKQTPTSRVSLAEPLLCSRRRARHKHLGNGLTLCDSWNGGLVMTSKFRSYVPLCCNIHNWHSRPFLRQGRLPQDKGEYPMSGEHYPLLHIPTQVVLTFGRTYVLHCMHLCKDAYLIFCEYVVTLFLSYCTFNY